MSIVRDGAEAICEECGLLIRRSADGTFVHHLRPVDKEPGAEQLRAYFAACVNLGKELQDEQAD